MNWGWRGIFSRALEFVSGAAVAVSPPGRARVRYHEQMGELQGSLSGGPYSTIAVGGPSPTAANQPLWYIDPAGGNDNNRGSSPATAIRTFAEYSRRIGDQVVPVMQTVFLLGNLAEGSYLMRGNYRAGMVVQGERTALAAGVLDATQPWNLAVAPVVDGRLTDAGLVGGWGPYVGKMIVLASGAHAGKIGWILKDLGGGVCRCSQFVDVLTYATGFPSGGDGYRICDITEMAGLLLVETSMMAGQGWIELEDVEVVGQRALVARGASFYFGACKFRSTATLTSDLVDCYTDATGTLWSSSQRHRGGSFFGWCTSFLDGKMEFVGAQGSFWDLCPNQQAVGGLYAGHNLLSVLGGANVCVDWGSWGALDVATGGQAAIWLDPGGVLSAGAAGTFWTFNQTNGLGCAIDAGGAAYWSVGTVCAAHYNFNAIVLGTEFSLGGAITTAAVLGAPGAINPGNNAAAVPRII